MNWNFDLSQAPRGKTVEYEKTLKDKVVNATKFVPDKIFLAAKDGGVVTIGYWIPKENRWSMFATGEDPIAWMPWPIHPEVDA